MSYLEPPENFNNKKSFLDDYNERHSKVLEACADLPMQSQFEFIKQSKNIDNLGINPKTKRHEMTDLDIKELKLMLKQVLLQKMTLEKLFFKMNNTL